MKNRTGMQFVVIGPGCIGAQNMGIYLSKNHIDTIVETLETTEGFNYSLGHRIFDNELLDSDYFSKEEKNTKPMGGLHQNEHREFKKRVIKNRKIRRNKKTHRK